LAIIFKACCSAELAPLYCLAISSKRYVLFNLDEQGQPIIRKASAHGLGHLMAPMKRRRIFLLLLCHCRRSASSAGNQIIRAVLDGHPEQADLNYHPALQLPAMSRYAVTTPALERWFKKHNATRPNEDRVKPFNFMCHFQASPLAATGEETFIVGDGSKSPRKTKQRPLRPIAPYSRTSQEASARAFDRETGKPILADQLKTYASPNTICGRRRNSRHVQAIQINYIGKEANRWEEQFFLGMDEDAAIEYGADPNAAALFDDLMVIIGRFGKQELASRIGVSRNSLTKILDMKCQNLSPRISHKIGSAITSF
jgi:hypothetical protein